MLPGKSLEEMAEVFGDEIDPDAVLPPDHVDNLDELKTGSESIKHIDIVHTA